MNHHLGGYLLDVQIPSTPTSILREQGEVLGDADIQMLEYIINSSDD